MREGIKVCIVFEGRDTAGKGGVIKRITERVSPRVFRVVALPAPTDREKSQMYVQRYLSHFPAAGEIVIFDRSWYHRAGVERVMGFTRRAEPKRARVRHGRASLRPHGHHRQRARPNTDLRQREPNVVAQRTREPRCLLFAEAVVAECHDGVADEQAIRRADRHQDAVAAPRIHLQLGGRRHSPQAETE